MGTSLRSAAALVAVALIVVVPWLVWTPLGGGPTASVLLGALALVAAFHGWGRAVAWLARSDDESPAVLVQWGIAAVIALGGVLLVVHGYNARLLVVAGLTLHTIAITTQFFAWRDALAEGVCWEHARFWLIPAVLLVGLGLVHVLAGAGMITRPFDDDGNIVAQIKRLADTGTLADPIGYARVSQLGGARSLDGLIYPFADPRNVRMLDGLSLVLLLWLGVSRIRPRDVTSAIWASLLVIAGGAFAIAWPDRLPLWFPTGLVVALVITLEDTRQDARGCIPLALVAASLCTIRGELAPAAIAMLVGAWWFARRPLREDLARLAVLAGIVAFVVGMYALARSLAWSHVDAAARTLIEPRRGSAVIRALLSIVLGAAVLPLLLVVLPKTAELRTLRCYAFACAASIGGIAGKLTSERIYGTRSLWILAIGAFVLLVARAARRRELDRLTFVLVMLSCLFVWEGRSAPGRLGWAWRYAEMMYDVEYARHVVPETGAYDDLLARVPPGERVDVWVTRPELLDYAHHDILDLRTPRAAKLRDIDPADPRFGRLLRATRARWLVVEIDDLYTRRSRLNILYRLVCPDRTTASCADSIEAHFLAPRVVATSGTARLLDLRE